MQQSLRMVVALFLTERLNIHWRHGAAWFHDTLVCKRDICSLFLSTSSVPLRSCEDWMRAVPRRHLIRLQPVVVPMPDTYAAGASGRFCRWQHLRCAPRCTWIHAGVRCRMAALPVAVPRRSLATWPSTA